jgi:cytochrome c551/c552
MQLKRNRASMFLPTARTLPYRETTVIQSRNHRTDGLILIDRSASRSFTRLWALAAAALLISATHAAEPEPTPLVDQQHCMFRHTDNAAFLAPSFQQISDRYRNVPNAAAMLEHKLRVGGPAHWGDMAMPSPGERGGPLSAQDAHTLVLWVLSH